MTDTDKRFSHALPGGPRSRHDWNDRPRQLQNVKNLGPLTPDAEEWWHSFGRHLDSAHRDWDKRRNA